LKGVVYIQLLRGKDLRAKKAPYAVMQVGKFTIKTEEKKNRALPIQILISLVL